MTASGAIFLAGLAVIAGLYASVGQAGGTGYVALMGLAGLAPSVVKPSALALNVLVASIATARFARAGLLSWRACYPFGVLGAPFSILGGALHLPEALYEPVVGVLLLVAAAIVVRRRSATADLPVEAPFVPALLTGAGIGFVSGVTGVGGGIFLAPVVLAARWADIRTTAAISAVFNLLNSAAALTGSVSTGLWPPPEIGVWLCAVGVGGAAGAWLSVRHLPVRVLRGVLAVILSGAGIRMLF